jgi:hypothetical protein
MNMGKALLCVAALLFSTYAIGVEMPSRMQTVNSYTPAQEKQARDAAKVAGYAAGKVLFVQAGNFFFNGSRDGHHYGLTVTPEGKVYASGPVD